MKIVMPKSKVESMKIEVGTKIPMVGKILSIEENDVGCVLEVKH